MGTERTNMRMIRLAAQEDCAEIEAVAQDAYRPYLERMDKKPFLMLDDMKPIFSESMFMCLKNRGGLLLMLCLFRRMTNALLDNIGVDSCFQKNTVKNLCFLPIDERKSGGMAE